VLQTSDDSAQGRSRCSSICRGCFTSSCLNEAVEDLLAAGFLEVDIELVAVDRGDGVAVELRVEHALAERELVGLAAAAHPAVVVGFLPAAAVDPLVVVGDAPRRPIGAVSLSATTSTSRKRAMPSRTPTNQLA
jgi:hypothetical protein